MRRIVIGFIVGYFLLEPLSFAAVPTPANDDMPISSPQTDGERVKYCECHGSGGNRTLWLYSSEIGGWRLIAEYLTAQQCLDALHFAPCI